jgi:two-component system, sensor histidine kinase and response regulator
VTPPAARALGTNEAVTPRRVLLVEDNAVNQRVAIGLLERRGHRVTAVGNGRDALDQLEAVSFDIVLMDLQMPVMSGLDATAAIRARERATGGHVPIVAMTAHAMAGDRDRCLDAGMDGYLSKPVDPQLLFAAVEQHAATVAVPVASATPAIFDMAALLGRVAGDRELMIEVIRLFLEDYPGRLRNIAVAMDANDADAVRIAAHALKGAAGSLGAVAVYETSSALEQLGAEGRLDAARATWERLLVDVERFVAEVRPLDRAIIEPA